MTTRPNDARPVVMKFGGTSVQDAAAMRRVVAIAEGERGAMPVIVASACAGVTDALLACARCAGERRLEDALRISASIRERHLGLLCELAPEDDHSRALLAGLLDEIDQLVHGVLLLGELSRRTTDLFASYGERLSSIVLVAAFRTSGWRAGLADSRRFIITDDTFTDAVPLMAEIDERVAAALRPLVDANEVVVAQGFIGSTRGGVTTTIGRGGSDHTGALVGAALGAREIQIWTDVSGILTADPRLVPAARAVPEVTFTEARELAYFGAKVLHPDTILPAVARAIPVVIRNSLRPADAGTRILPDGSPVAPGVHSITLLRGMTLLRLAPRDPNAGLAPVETALGLFAEHDVTLQCALIAESRAIVMAPAAALHDILLTALEATCTLETVHDMALVSLAGAALLATPSALAEPLAALAGIPIAFVGAGSSDHLLLIGIAEASAAEALLALHKRLFE